MSAKIIECVGGKFLVEVSTDIGCHVTRAASQKSAETFVQIIETWCADDRREGRVSGAASLAGQIE